MWPASPAAWSLPLELEHPAPGREGSWAGLEGGSVDSLLSRAEGGLPAGLVLAFDGLGLGLSVVRSLKAAEGAVI